MKSEFIDNRRGLENTASMTTENKSIVQRAQAGLIERATSMRSHRS